ncbi:MAG: NAD+ synthase [Deferribacteres bacterium]|nr:NAD+ synthase [candidate division KSB1 bacterium]MCB9512239.1 NAD+ synthase [Deferribacteres bacterium]
MKTTSTCRIALAQMNAIVGDFEYNAQQARLHIEQAEAASADFVLLPELVLCGYPPEDLVYKPSFMRENKRQLQQLAAQVGNIVAIVGFADNNGGGIYNAAAILHRGQIVAIYHKICLPNYDVFDEKRTFRQGTRPLVLDLGGHKIGINICEDIWQAGVAEHQAIEGGASLICNISASPYHARRSEDRESMLETRARSCHAFLAYANMVGAQDDLVFDGGSYLYNPKGEMVSRGPFFEEALVIADVELPSKKASGQKYYFQHTYQLAHEKLDFQFNTKRDHRKPQINPTPGALDEILSALVLGTRDYVQKNGFKKVVIGLSGGIDSALTAVIAQKALGEDNVIGVLMPSRFSSKSSIDDSLALAQNLRIQTYTVGIDSIVSCFEQALQPLFEGTSRDITEENLQARARGNILMALSNKFGWLVLTTGNKSETSVGYCTLYGDMAGGFAVLKDVLKTLVYQLSKSINRDGELIPNNIITKPPSAELRPDQKDEDSLPPYDTLDRILTEYVENDKSVSEMINAGFDAQMVREIVRLVDLNEYKRRQAPPGIRITPKAFGRDRRMPITNHFTHIEINYGKS